MNISNDMNMTDAQWQQLIAQVADQYDSLTLMRGFQYYKQKRVAALHYSEQGNVSATVQGSDEHEEATLNPYALSESQCTCPAASGCRHIAAIMMSWAEQLGRPVQAIANAHTSTVLKRNSSKPVGKASSGRAGHTVIPRTETPPDYGYMKLKEEAASLAELHIDTWHDLFAKCLVRLGTGTPSISYVQEAQDELYAIKPKLSPGMDQLFALHAHLHLLRFCVPERGSIPSMPIYLNVAAQMAADALLQNAENELNRPLELSNQSEAERKRIWGRVQETVQYLRSQMLSETQTLLFFTPIYRQLWLNWIVPLSDKRVPMLESELRTLVAVEQEIQRASMPTGGSRDGAANGSGSEQRVKPGAAGSLPLALAQGWILFHLERDERAWQLLGRGHSAFGMPPEHLMHFLHVLADDSRWERLAAWLGELGPLLVGRRNDSLQAYMQLWDDTLRHLPEEENRMWDTLVGMLPHSRPAYEEAMHQRGQWRRWIDFQLSTGAEPLDFRVAMLEPIEKEAPELLLPFYHQAAERHIEQRNRDGYKAAVKLLKRLAKLYKKLKQEERWEAFITSLAVRNSRLRALQEELRKGKLIS